MIRLQLGYNKGKIIRSQKAGKVYPDPVGTPSDSLPFGETDSGSRATRATHWYQIPEHISISLLDLSIFQSILFSESIEHLNMTPGWFGTFIFPYILGMSSSQLTNSYFSEGRSTTNHIIIHRLSIDYPYTNHILSVY